MGNSAQDANTDQKDEVVEAKEKTATPDQAAKTKKKAAVETTADTTNSGGVTVEASASKIKDSTSFDPQKMGVLNDLNIALTIEIGRSEIKIRDLLNLTKGSIIELNKLSGEPVEMYANGKLIALGEIITVNGRYSVRLLSFNENMQMGAKGNGK